METLLSHGHMVAFDWIKNRDPPPLTIQWKFHSGWANNLIGTACLHGMISIKPAFDPITFCAFIHVWVQNQKPATEIGIFRSNSQKNFHNIPGHYWCYTSEVKCLYCSVSPPMYFGFVSQESWQNATAARHVDFNVHLLQFFSLARYYVVFFCIPARAKAVLNNNNNGEFLFAFSNRNWNDVNLNATPVL